MPTTTVKNNLVTFTNEQEFAQLKKEIFDRHSYYFECEQQSPLIFDLGAHIGLSTLYFKMLYPASEIIAVEPMPASFSILEENCRQNHLDQVHLVSKAIAAQTGQQTLYIDQGDDWFSTASFTAGAWTQDQPTIPISVSTTTLAELIAEHADRPIDLVKMDIEGAEYQVLLAAHQELTRIKELIIEYHPLPKNNLTQLLDHLKKFGLVLDSDLDRSPKHSRQLQLLRFVNHKHPSS